MDFAAACYRMLDRSQVESKVRVQGGGRFVADGLVSLRRLQLPKAGP